MTTIKTEAANVNHLCTQEIKLADLLKNSFTKIKLSTPPEKVNTLELYITINILINKALISIKANQPYDAKELIKALEKLNTLENDNLKRTLKEAMAGFSDRKISSNAKKLFEAARKYLRNITCFYLSALIRDKSTSQKLSKYLLAIFGLFIEDDNSPNIQPEQADTVPRFLLSKDILTIIVAETIFSIRTGVSRLNFLREPSNPFVKLDLFELTEDYKKHAVSLGFSAHIFKEIMDNEAEIVLLEQTALSLWKSTLKYSTIDLAGSYSSFYKNVIKTSASSAESPRNRSSSRSRLAIQLDLNDLNTTNALSAHELLNHSEQQEIMETMLECLKNLKANVNFTNCITKLLEFNNPALNNNLEMIASNVQKIITFVKESNEFLTLNQDEAHQLNHKLTDIKEKSRSRPHSNSIQAEFIPSLKKETSSILFGYFYEKMVTMVSELSKDQNCDSYQKQLKELPQWITTNRHALGGESQKIGLTVVLANKIIKLISINIHFKLFHNGLSVREYLQQPEAFPPAVAEYLFTFSHQDLIENAGLNNWILKETLEEEKSKLKTYEAFVFPIITFTIPQPRPAIIIGALPKNPMTAAAAIEESEDSLSPRPK